MDARRALAVGVAGLVVALVGQMALDRRALFGPVPGWLLLGAGAVLAATGLVGAGGFPRRAVPARAGALHGPGRRGAIAAAGGALLVLGAVPGFVGLAQTDGHAAGGTLAWGLWLAGAVLFAGALGVGRGPGAAAEAPRPLWRRLWPWLLILAVAAGLRFYALDLVPRGLWADESIAGMQAEQIWDTGWRPLFIGGQNGEPALYLYPIALLIRIFGPTILPLRLPMALAGTAAVAAIGWLARPLYGRRAALAAAAILAAMTWEINFSRIGFNAIWSLPVDLLAAGCLVRALATGRVRWYAWAGLLLGLGFQLYYISRAWLGLMVLLVAYRLLTERGLWRRARGGLAILLAGLLIGAAPVLVYALVQPADYAARASTVAVTAAIQQAGNLSPLGSSILAHLGMWNFAGDPNGRHDLPGARMLDLITAALLPCGLVIALLLAWRQRHGRVLAWRYLFPAAGLFVLLAGGILSAPDESPQALRTLGDTSAVALLAALPVVGLWRALPRPVRPGMPAWGTVAAVAMLALIVGANARRYFFVQEINPDVYKAFSTPARLAVEIVQQQPPTTDDFLAMGLYEQATVQYLAGQRIGTAFTSPHETPLPPGAPGHAALLLLDNRNTATLDWLRTLYPHATIRSIEGPAGGNALFFSVLIPAADRNAPYYVNLTLRDAAGVQVTRAVTDGVTLDWGALPLPSATWPVTATWQGALQPGTSGRYHLAATGANPSASLEIAGRAFAAAGSDADLIAGRYPFTLTVRADGPGAATQLRWAGPLTGTATVSATQAITRAALLAPDLGVHGVTASYRNSGDPSAPVDLVREEPTPSWFFFYTPFGVTPFVGEWQGTLLAPSAGTYGFEVDIGGRPDLWLDGQPLQWHPAGLSALNSPLYDATVTLAAGAHTFRFRDVAPGWREPCILFWTPPGQTQAVIPNSAFLPDLWRR